MTNVNYNQIGDTIKQQLLTWGMMSNNKESGMIQVVVGLVVIQFVNFFMEWTPIVVGYIKNAFEERLKKGIADKGLVFSPKLEPKSTILYHVQNGQLKLGNSVMEYLSRRNNAMKLMFIDRYIVTNQETFDVGFSDIKCKFMNLVYENSKFEKCDVVLYSYEIELKDIREWVESIHEDYMTEIRNKLGNNQYYFEEISKTNSKVNSFKMSIFKTNKSLNNVFGPKVKEIRDRLDTFIRNPEWYAKRGIPKTLGFVLHGPPGCGKTSSIKAIAKDTGKHIISFRLTNDTTCNFINNLFFNEKILVTNENGQNESVIVPLNKRIYVIEDADTGCDVLLSRKLSSKSEHVKEKSDEETTDKRWNVETNPTEKDSKLTLGYILNVLDGILETPDRILILTSNYPEKLDSALIRPGRIDMIIHFDRCLTDTANDIFNFFFDTDISPFINIDNKFTPAELNNIIGKYPNDPDKVIEEVNEQSLILDKELQLALRYKEYAEFKDVNTSLIDLNENETLSKKNLPKETGKTIDTDFFQKFLDS
jgi:DNA polymerase III delta prime subunit